tara:strand:- start:357 stop:476 length:120 start_codon:yes stop_codon:yes gene_type:complete
MNVSVHGSAQQPQLRHTPAISMSITPIPITASAITGIIY